ncbi:hypothetical protein [Idiomarina seosinensis]|uniref:Toxin co-regulated pilus biosynthesis protein Q C-terminal domain-containing protein n=1 Tax=Idiomarina seosinensis TaxID=281739 RepID=A0A432ZGT2_9GAMM|nr:hypothetical protein [Idiomarina seosinensis]RUO77161.1 hypothetical protein CWI81_01280 [Idiomarina seosinensis]
MKSQRSYSRQLLGCCSFILLAAPVASAAGLSSCQPLLHAKPSFASIGSTSDVAQPVSLQLLPGQLEPQIRRLLKEHLAIKVLDWQASPHHQWPTKHIINAQTWAELLRRVLQPYQLQLVMHPNQSAVVRYRDGSTS